MYFRQKVQEDLCIKHIYRLTRNYPISALRHLRSPAKGGSFHVQPSGLERLQVLYKTVYTSFLPSFPLEFHTQISPRAGLTTKNDSVNLPTLFTQLSSCVLLFWVSLLRFGVLPFLHYQCMPKACYIFLARV